MKATISVALLKKLIAATKDFVSTNEAKPVHTYIKLHFFPRSEERRMACVKAAAVDGYSLSIEWEACNDVDEEFAVLIKPTILQTIGICEEVTFERIDKTHMTVDAGAVRLQYGTPDEADFMDVDKALPECKPEYEIGFRGKFLAKALKAASIEGRIDRPVVMEFRDPLNPIILRKRNELDMENIKLVLPIRIRSME